MIKFYLTERLKQEYGTIQGKDMHMQANRCASNASDASEILLKRRGRDKLTDIISFEIISL